MGQLYRKINKLGHPVRDAWGKPIVLEELPKRGKAAWAYSMSSAWDGKYHYKVRSGRLRLMNGMVLFEKGDVWKKKTRLGAQEWKKVRPVDVGIKTTPKPSPGAKKAVKNPCPRCEQRSKMKGHYLCEDCVYGGVGA
jgi:hypothetical protein